MRFVMMEHEFGREEVPGFLDSLKDALAAATAGLERYAAGHPDGRHPRLALEHGLAVQRASLQWAGHAIAEPRAAAPAPAPQAAPLPPRVPGQIRGTRTAERKADGPAVATLRSG
jgi:hypothetical protein